MNDNLAAVVKKYSVHGHEEYAQLMHGYSKDTLISMFTDLLTLYINDKNSSTLREFITVVLAGYTHEESKIGYNGFRHVAAGKPVACEAKPKNVSAREMEEYQCGKRKTVRKLNGGGNFTDYTWGRFNRNLRDNPRMLVSGFVDGKLIYILEFPFASAVFAKRLREQLQRHFPHGDQPGRFLRSANFDYRHFMDDENLRVVHCRHEFVLEHKTFFVGSFYNRLISLIAEKK